MSIWLTKTDFITAFSCKTRLNYIREPKKYPDSSQDDNFQKILADAGYLVQRLAELKYGNAEKVNSDNNIALKETKNLLLKEETVIFEAAIENSGFFIRVDILRKKQNQIDLIEVKAKSYDEKTFQKNRSEDKSWVRYIRDLAFQYFVTRKAYPNFKVNCFLCMPNKNGSPEDNLVGKFHFKNREIDFRVSQNELTEQIINNQILVEEMVTEDIEKRVQEVEENAESFLKVKSGKEQAPPDISRECKTCTYRDNDNSKSGVYECWKSLEEFSEEKFKNRKIIDIWNFRKAPELIESNKYFIDSLSPEDLHEKFQSGKKPIVGDKPFSIEDRQYFQCFPISEFQNKEGYIFNTGYFKKQIRNWKYPFNFIDFEATNLSISPTRV